MGSLSIKGIMGSSRPQIFADPFFNTHSNKTHLGAKVQSFRQHRRAMEAMAQAPSCPIALSNELASRFLSWTAAFTECSHASSKCKPANCMRVTLGYGYGYDSIQ